MTVTLVSGKTLEFDNIWIKYPIIDLSEEHQKVIIEKLKRELPPDYNAYRIRSNFYVAGGRNWTSKEKFEDQWLIIPREEVERILKTYDRYVVWVDSPNDEECRYWMTGNGDLKYSGYGYGWETWYPLADDGDPEYDGRFHWNEKTQRLVNDFFLFGGIDGALKFYEEAMAKAHIPQYANYCEKNIAKVKRSEAEKNFFGFEESKYFVDDDPAEIWKDYVDLVRGFVHEYDGLEKMKELMSFTRYDNWRIVKDTLGDAGDIESDIQCDPPKVTIDQVKNGDDLRKWLSDNFLSQAKAAELCNVAPRTFRRWIAEKPFIPKGALELLFKKINN